MRILGNLLIIISLVILIYVYGPVINAEIKYNLDKFSKVKYVIGDNEILNSFEKPLTPPNTDFSIVIPKIGATAAIVANVNSQNKSEYVRALKRGVAHAAGTSTPGEYGNTYLFAHSTDAFYNVNQYNAIFYLIGKLEKDDEIVVYYLGREIIYKVSETKVVNAEEIKY